MANNKRIKSANFVRNVESIFQCPVCGSAMQVLEFTSLICLNHHTFDFSKQGYINLLNRQIKTKYTKPLFEARRKLIRAKGFFEPLSRELMNLYNQYLLTKKETLFILDEGCGEGSHLARISDMIGSEWKKTVIGAGIDISKEGIQEASKYYGDTIWAVANLANTPFKDKQFDIILNILSPSNYEELNRVLKADGLVEKVVPQIGYLKEVRDFFFDGSDKRSYSNIEIVKRFYEHFRSVRCSRLCYTAKLDRPALQLLAQMTPLTWGSTEDQIQSFLEMNVGNITVDLDILVGQKIE